MKKIIFGVLLLNTLNFYAQAVTINTTNNSATELVNEFLGANNNATNASKSIGNGIGYFQNTNPAFPFSNGIVISTGNVNAIIGTNNVSGTGSNATDANLQAFANSIGLTGSINDASYLSYNFTANSPQLSFDYLFASEDYGQFQCAFSDVVAFLLTDLTTNVTTNMAIVPGTTVPVSVVNIRDAANNSSCTSVNPQFFGVYNAVNNPATNGTSFNGRTVVMNASANLVLGHTYKLKMVIGDYQDALYDSAMFIKASPVATNVLGADLTVANNTAICQGATYVLNTGLSNSGYIFQWYYGGVLQPTQTNSSVTFSFEGNWKVIYKEISTQIEYVDEIVIENIPPIDTLPFLVEACNFYILQDLLSGNYYSEPNGQGTQYAAGTVITSSININIYNGCENGVLVINITSPTSNSPINLNINEENSDGFATFDLSSQIPYMLNGLSPNDFQVSFYATLSDATNGTNPISNLIAFTNSTNPQVIFTKVTNLNGSNCSTEGSFTISVNNIPTVTFQDFIIYEQSTDGVAVFDLTAQIPAIIGANADPANFVVTFFTSLDDATNNLNPIANPTQFTNTTNPQTIYVRVTSTNGRTTTTTVFGTMELSVQESLSTTAFDNAKIVVSPNPVIDFMTISSKENLSEVSIYNVLGQLVFRTKIQSKQQKIDLTTLAGGNYVVKINGNIISKTFKIVKR